MEIGGHATVDWTVLEEVDEAARTRDYIGHDTPWDRLADQPEELFDPEEPWVEVSIRLAGEWHEMSLREFAVLCGLYTLEETDTPFTPRASYGPPFDTCQVLESDQFRSLWALEFEGFTYHRPHVPLLAQAYCTTRAESRVVQSGGSVLSVLSCMGETYALHHFLA
ncbi:hypothetical protein Hanom_Chr15g01406421 [Helianthus anomalus]